MIFVKVPMAVAIYNLVVAEAAVVFIYISPICNANAPAGAPAPDNISTGPGRLTKFPGLDRTTFPALTVTPPVVTVIPADVVKVPVTAVFPVAFPILTAPVPPVPKVVTAAPVVLILVVPVNETGPGVTVKDANVPAPPDVVTCFQVAKLLTMLVSTYTALVELFIQICPIKYLSEVNGLLDDTIGGGNILVNGDCPNE